MESTAVVEMSTISN